MLVAITGQVAASASVIGLAQEHAHAPLCLTFGQLAVAASLVFASPARPLCLQVDQFTITGNRLGLDWDANRGGDGPAIGGCGCWATWLVPMLAMQEVAGGTATSDSFYFLPRVCAAGHWNVAGRWEDLWADQSPFRVGIDAYLAAGNASTKHRSLQDIYRCWSASCGHHC